LKRLYFTHCCAKKDESLKATPKKVSPLLLYTATPTQRFMRRCIEAEVEWAIFSDEYGFVFPSQNIGWYEKQPNSLTLAEKKELFEKAFDVLEDYDLSYFYYNPGRIHPFYLELLSQMRKRGVAIKEITHLVDIF